MSYLSMCIKKGMRLHSPIPHIARVGDREFEIEGHIIPVGTRVTIHFHQLHHNTAAWGDDHDVRLYSRMGFFQIFFTFACLYLVSYSGTQNKKMRITITQ